MELSLNIYKFKTCHAPTLLFPLHFAASLFEICCSRDSQTASQTCSLMSLQHSMVRLQRAYLNLTLWNGSSWQGKEEKHFPRCSTLSPFLGKLHSFTAKKVLILSQSCLQIFHFTSESRNNCPRRHVMFVLFILLLKTFLLEKSN